MAFMQCKSFHGKTETQCARNALRFGIMCMLLCFKNCQGLSDVVIQNYFGMGRSACP